LYTFKNSNLEGTDVFSMKPLFLIEQRIDKHKKNKIQHQFEVNQGYFLDQLLGKKFRDKKKKL